MPQPPSPPKSLNPEGRLQANFVYRQQEQEERSTQ